MYRLYIDMCPWGDSMSTICKDDCIVGVYSGGFASQIFDVPRGMKYHLFYHYTLAQVAKKSCAIALHCQAYQHHWY